MSEPKDQDIVQRARKAAELPIECATEIERLRQAVDSRDVRLAELERLLFFANKLRDTEGQMLRGMIAARDAEIERLKESNHAR